jgi:cullin 3
LTILPQAEERIVSEKARAQLYLPTTEEALVTILKSRLLTPHLSAIVSMPSSGLDNMIDSRQDNAVTRLYRLFIMVPEGLGILKRALKDSIAMRGKQVNDADGNDADPDVDVVQVEDEPYQGKGKEKAKARPAAPPGRKTLDIALKWVQGVLDLKDMFDRLLKTSFCDDNGIQASLNEVGSNFYP